MSAVAETSCETTVVRVGASLGHTPRQTSVMAAASDAFFR